MKMTALYERISREDRNEGESFSILRQKEYLETYAAANGFDAFTSTLFYSIYQQHDLMRRTAEHFAEKYGVAFHYEDFRPGWQEGIDISHELDLYRQPYCGCIFSEEERYSREIRKQRKKENKAKKRARLEREAREAQAAAANS